MRQIREPDVHDMRENIYTRIHIDEHNTLYNNLKAMWHP